MSSPARWGSGVVRGGWPGWALAAIVGVTVVLGWTRLALTQSGAVTLGSSGDTYLKQGAPNSNQGTETLLRIQQSGDNRVLLKFDQPALEQAVGSSSIRSAKLRLYIASNTNNWGTDGREVNVHRVTQAWTEAGATWSCPNDTNTANASADCSPGWDMGGSSVPPFVFAPTQVILHQNNQTGWVEWDVTPDVRKFLSHEVTNYGWIIRRDDEAQTGHVDYSSREAANAPQLVIELGEPAPAGPGLTPISDADVRSGAANQNQGNRMRLQVQGAGNNRVLAQFDRPAMVQTVGSGTLQTAKLRLYIVSNGNNWGSSGRTVNVHRLTQAWTEQGATWNCANDLNPFNSQSDCTPNWNMSNSSQWPFVAAATSSLIQQNNQTGWVEWDVTADVAQILSNSVPNHGWIIRKDNENQAGQVEYGSRESQNKPELVFTVQASNQAPQVSAGSDQTITLPATASLSGTASDDGFPTGSTLTTTWSLVSGPGAVTFGNANALSTTATFSTTGNYILRLTATDTALTSADDVNVTVNAAPVNEPPQVSAGPDQTITLPASASLAGSASDDGLPTGSTLTVTWSKVSGLGTVTFNNPNASVTTATFSVAGDYILRLTASDSLLSSTNDVAITVNPASQPLPPDPVSVAPPLDRTVVTTVFKASEFLYSGSNPIQTGVAPGTITPIRAAVLRGKVITRDGQPLSGVSISIANHPELGQTLSRADGLFDLAVNGGGLLNVNYEKAGSLPAQRQVSVPWQDYRSLPTVALIPLDPQVSTIAAGSAAIQVHQGSLVTDSDGSRRATLLFPAGTTATMELSGGATQALSTLHVRATEFTVGTNGPQAMPATLPANSFYTYCVEFSVDEAIAANARTVRFSQPVVKYVDNFLRLAIGTAVPEGYYDRQQAQWVASDSGRVVQVLAVVDSQAILDVDGSGTAATPAALASLGITGTERLKLAELYAPGQSFWRVPIGHFTAWDSNWGVVPPNDATRANQKLKSDNQTDCYARKTGSVIECQNQVLGESVGLTGVRFGLHYNSDRVPGRLTARTLDIPLSGSSIPASLKRIRLEVEIAGKRFEQEYPAAANQNATFTWDGQDAYGRLLQGSQPARVAIGYVYDAEYGVTSRFGYNGNGDRISVIGSGGGGGGGGSARARVELTFWQELSAAVGVWEPEAAGLGSWTLSVHHGYDPVGKTLYQGTGERRRAEDLNTKVVTTVAGNRSLGLGGDGGPATQSPMDPPFGIAFAPDGSLYITDVNYSRVRKVNPQGIISTFAGIASGGFTGDGGPANMARLDTPKGVAVGADGRVFIADTNNHRIRRVALDGIITTVAGTGVAGFNGDGGLATLAQLNFPHGLAMGPDGSLYVADKQNHRIRRIEPGGTITTVAGNGVGGFDGHGIPATQTRLKAPEAVAVRPDGALLVADTDNHLIRLVTTSGLIFQFAGTGPGGLLTDGEGVPAVAAGVVYPNALAIDSTGGFFVTSQHRVRYVDPQRRIYTAAGKTDGGNSNDGDPASETLFNGPSGLAVGLEGNLYISDTYGYRVRKVGRVLPDQVFTDVVIASGDGSQVYQFNAEGKHLRTLNALTGAVLYQFSYNGQGLLTTVTDADGDITTVERDGAGKPTGIVGPFGQRTTLTVDGFGYLTGVTNPNNQTVQLTAGSTGLLLSMRDPKNQQYVFQYDSQGRLTRDEDPAGGFQNLSRLETSAGYEVTHQPALSQITRYQVNQLSNGEEQLKNFSPDGTLTTLTIGANGTRTFLDSDGTQTTLQLGGDPRWGLQTPLAKTESIRTPAGLLSNISFTRSAVLSDPANPLSLLSETDTLNVNGRTYTNVFNNSTKTFTSTTPVGRQSTSVIDNLGRVLQSQFASLHSVRFSYDSRGRPETVKQGSGSEERTTTLAYSSNGYLQTATDPLLRVTSFQYDDSGRVTQQMLPGNRIIGFNYDANGNLTSLTPPGKPQHAFDYTSVDLMNEYDPPTATNVGTRVTTYAYDTEHKPTLITRPDGQTIDFDYDTTGRLSTLNLTSRQLTYGYDATTGNLTSISDSTGSSLAYTYDGSLPKSTTWSGPVTGRVGWNHDNNFRVTSRSINGGDTINFGYDNDSLLTSAGSLTLTRNAQNGLLTGTTLGNVTDTWTYNNFAEPTSYSASVSGTPVYSTTFTHDKLGRITTKTETIQEITDMYVYGYDAAGRLDTVTKNGTLLSQYTYDANGNRQTKTTAAGTETYVVDNQDRLLTQNSALSTQNFAYSANGELQSKTSGSQTTTYSYDVVGNLRHVTLPDGTQMDYIIDAQNRRVGKKVNSVLVQGWLYGDQLNPVAELDSSGNIVSTFIYGSRSNVPDYIVKNGVTYRILSDHLGSPRLVINTGDGNVPQRLDYDEFGSVISDTNPGFQPFGFAAGLYDTQTRLARFGARDYDPEVGRWTAKDSIGFAGGDTNLYGYVVNDPVNFVDPDGQSWMWWFKNLLKQGLPHKWVNPFDDSVLNKDSCDANMYGPGCPLDPSNLPEVPFPRAPKMVDPEMDKPRPRPRNPKNRPSDCPTPAPRNQPRHDPEHEPIRPIWPKPGPSPDQGD